MVQGKHQPACRQAGNQINSNDQYPKLDFFNHRLLFGYWSLIIGYYLEFGIWLLGFKEC
jgi:hypothetical protein